MTTGAPVARLTANGCGAPSPAPTVVTYVTLTGFFEATYAGYTIVPPAPPTAGKM